MKPGKNINRSNIYQCRERKRQHEINPVAETNEYAALLPNSIHMRREYLTISEKTMEGADSLMYNQSCIVDILAVPFHIIMGLQYRVCDFGSSRA